MTSHGANFAIIVNGHFLVINHFFDYVLF
jgi:hypothetical protein